MFFLRQELCQSLRKGARNYNLILQGYLDPGTNPVIEQTKAPEHCLGKTFNQKQQTPNATRSFTAAYVPQTAWIQSGNIEENILFGSPVDKQRYKRVIEACSLKKDLKLLQYGDQTVIGDRGINFKWRSETKSSACESIVP
jgi:hypothetical protein